MDTAEQLQVKQYEHETEIAELENSIKSNLAYRLLPLVQSHGEYKGEIKYITPKQYKLFFSREPLPNVKDKRGRIRWEYVLDQLAGEHGAISGDELKEALEKLSQDSARLDELKTGKAGIKADIHKAKTTRSLPPRKRIEKKE